MVAGLRRLGQVGLRSGRSHLGHRDEFIVAAQADAELLPGRDAIDGCGREDVRPRREGEDGTGGDGDEERRRGRHGFRGLLQQQEAAGGEPGAFRQRQGADGSLAAAAHDKFEAGKVGLRGTGVVQFDERVEALAGQGEFIDLDGLGAADAAADGERTALPGRGEIGPSGGTAFRGRQGEQALPPGMKVVMRERLSG